MSNRERADLFTKYVGLELKGRITTRGFTAKQVASSMNRSVAAFSNWLNGNAAIPMSVTCEACEIIGVSPEEVVESAYVRLVDELGPATAKSTSAVRHIGLAALDPETAPLDGVVMAANTDNSQSTIDGGHIDDENQDV